MIVVDSSALVAIVLGEPEAERLLAALSAEVVAISAATLTEATIVVEARQGPDATRDLDLLVEGAVDEIVRENGKVREAFDPDLPWPLHLGARLR